MRHTVTMTEALSGKDAWMDPAGTFHWFARNLVTQSATPYVSHDAYARRTWGKAASDLMTKGWMRVVIYGDTLEASNDVSRPMNTAQTRTLRDYAIEHQFVNLLYSDADGRETRIEH